ncbi:MAG: nuclear transport factor 2 family protein [Bacteroidota bacterium]
MTGRHLVACLLILHLTQSLSAQDLHSLVDAEKAFAQTSVDKSTKIAFLEYFDHHSVAFTNGQAVLGRKEWEKKPENNNYLFWWPIFADIAASGDFGYTTGPAIVGPDRSTREVKSGLYYSTVWQKDDNGRWKVLADLGSSVYSPSENLTTLKTSARPAVARNDITSEARRELSALDKSYNGELNELKTSFDDAYFSDEARIHRRGIAPVIGAKAIANFYDNGGLYFFENLQSHLASSNDMAVTYGAVKITSTKDGRPITTNACYLRVWKIEEGEWNIVLDVIN